MSFAKDSDLNSLSKVSINYLFFGFYFFFISLIHVYHVFLIESVVTFSRYFFVFYAIVQCAIETILLVVFANAIKIFFRPKVMAFYCVVVFFLMLTHFIDFPLIRFMDMSFWYALNFISAESPQNFLELLYASNISLGVWLASGFLGVLILLSSIFFYRITERWTHRKPLIIHYPVLAAVLCTLCLFLMSWDYSTHQWVHRSHFQRYQKTLPWKSTFIRQRQEFFPLVHALKEPSNQDELLKKVDTKLVLEKKPDIFLFIIESLREDYINEMQAPHLYKFKNDFLSFDLALSNANATHLSWCSLFHSQFPFYWGKILPDQWKQGSIPLILLKKMGYKIHCYSSARLNYYHMDRLIFGENNYLADTLFTFDEQPAHPPCERDREAMEKMMQQMHAEEPGGRLFIVFLDSTHLDYSWPKDSSIVFTPFCEKINYVKAALSNSSLDQIKNRYRNSLFFVDVLFGRFMEVLNSYPGKEQALVIATGDHGEEFYEEGHLFHASSLSQHQTHIPLYYKFGTSNPLYKPSMTCHMDIFPSVFHYLTGHNCMRDVLQGQSIFSPDRWPYTIIARFNASRSPSEFCIHNGTHKLIAHFSDERNIFDAKGLRIISIKDLDDQIVPHDLNSLKEDFGPALDRIFSP